MPVLIHFYDKPALYRYSSILHRYVYTHIYTYLCTYIYFPEGMFTYFFPYLAWWHKDLVIWHGHESKGPLFLTTWDMTSESTQILKAIISNDGPLCCCFYLRVFGPLEFGFLLCNLRVVALHSCWDLTVTHLLDLCDCSRSRFFTGTWHEEDPFVLLPSLTIQLKNPSTGADHGTLTVPWLNPSEKIERVFITKIPWFLANPDMSFKGYTDGAFFLNLQKWTWNILMLLKSQILILSRNDWESSSRNNELKFDGHEVPGIREIVWIGDGQHSGIVYWWKTFVANPSSFTWWISHPIHPFIVIIPMFEASQQVLFFPSTQCSKQTVDRWVWTNWVLRRGTWFRRSKIRAGRNLFFEAALAEANFFFNKLESA